MVRFIPYGMLPPIIVAQPADAAVVDIEQLHHPDRRAVVPLVVAQRVIDAVKGEVRLCRLLLDHRECPLGVEIELVAWIP